MEYEMFVLWFELVKTIALTFHVVLRTDGLATSSFWLYSYQFYPKIEITWNMRWIIGYENIRKTAEYQEYIPIGM